MERIPEPELMEDDAQAQAYAEADFEEPHSRFITLFEDAFGSSISGSVLDLGCGPGDIAIRFVRTYPECIVHGVDGSRAMLNAGAKIVQHNTDIKDRVSFYYGLLPGVELPLKKYDVIISNSLLHHLRCPRVLWDSVKRYAVSGTRVFVQDLMRPASPREARRIVETYSGNEPEILKRDFYNSLLAAFEPGEIEEQLQTVGLSDFAVSIVSDRHVTISGRIKTQWP